MPRLIDAYKVRIDRDDYDTYSDYITALDAVTEAPTVDAEPVIRCKDCKHWLPHAQFGFDEANNEYHNYCELLVPEDDDYYAFTREADEFCSRAERKE